MPVFLGCALVVLPIGSRAADWPAVARDKAQVLTFLKKLKDAVERDAFADPRRLEETLGVRAEDWTVTEQQGRTIRHSSRIATDVPVLEVIPDRSSRRYGIIQSDDDLYYYFDMTGLGQVVGLSHSEVEAVLGSKKGARHDPRTVLTILARLNFFR